MPKMKVSVFPINSVRAGCLQALALALAALSLADEVTLVDGGRLSGDVLRIQNGGAIELQSALAADPLALIGDQVHRVEFTHAGDQPTPSGDTRIHFANGDFLTASLREYSRGGGALVDAEDMGKLEIPSQYLRSLAMGVRPAKTIYQGPDDLANWTTDNRRRSQNWRLAGDRLQVDGAGQIGRMLELPDHYVISFNLSWQGQPNFQMGFSDPLEEQQKRVDRYYLQFGRAGLEIKRESSSGRRYHTVGTLNRTPDQFQNRTMDIAIRVDRSESVIHLAINGQPEGRFMDPFDNPPSAGGISLVSNASTGNQHEIRNLKVESWKQETTEPTRISDGNNDPTRDALVIRQGDHYSGTLETIRKKGDDLVFTMKVDFREQPLVILGTDVAMVHFATKDDIDPPPYGIASADFVLQLHDRARLAVTRSSFEGANVMAEHPMLGTLNIPRVHVSALERHLKAENSDTK